MKFTPGPWEYSEGMIQRVGGNLDPVGQVRGWGWLQKLPDAEQIQDANGKLMAAAPELLQALEMILNAGRRAQRRTAIDFALAIIKKATE